MIVIFISLGLIAIIAVAVVLTVPKVRRKVFSWRERTKGNDYQLM